MTRLSSPRMSWTMRSLLLWNDFINPFVFSEEEKKMQYPQRVMTISCGMVNLHWVDENEEQMAVAAFVPREHHLHTFFVNPRFRGRGWGRRFLSEVETMMKRDGCNFVRVHLAPSTNENLRRVYQFFKDACYCYENYTLVDWIRDYFQMEERLRTGWMYKQF